jgi:hypothetical protein
MDAEQERQCDRDRIERGSGAAGRVDEASVGRERRQQARDPEQEPKAQRQGSEAFEHGKPREPLAGR